MSQMIRCKENQMGWFGKLVGKIVLQAQKRSEIEYQLPFVSPQKEKNLDELSGGYYWVNHKGKKPIRKMESVGFLKLDIGWRENDFLKPENILTLNENPKFNALNAHFIRTNNGVYYVYSGGEKRRCEPFNLNKKSLRQFDLEMSSNHSLRLSTQKVQTIKRKFCPNLKLNLNCYDTNIDLEEVKKFKNSTDVSSVSPADLELIALQQKNYTVRRYFVCTDDGAELDTLCIESNDANKSDTEKRYIINFCGNNGSCFDDIPDRTAEADAGYTAISFNYRGVLGSAGNNHPCESKQHLIDDGIRQVQALLDNNVNPNNINLSGISLGGAIAIEVAAHFHRNEIPIRVFADRTFSSLQTLVNSYASMLANTLLNPFSRLFYRTPFLAIPAYLAIPAKIIFWPISLLLLGLAYPIASIALQISDWNLNPGKAVQDIPEQSREYFVAKTPKSKQPNLFDEHVDDEVIPYSASLYKHPFLQQERRNQKKAVAGIASTDSTSNKYRKFFIQDKQNIHNTELSKLKNTSDKTGFDVRMQFFNRTIEKEDDTILMGAVHGFDSDSDSDSSYSQ